MSRYGFHLNESRTELGIKINDEKFDAAGVEAFAEQLDRIWGAQINQVTIDFAHVAFIDSSGIGALLSVQKRLTGSPNPITILDAKPAVRFVIELLRLHRVFALHETPPSEG